MAVIPQGAYGALAPAVGRTLTPADAAWVATLPSAGTISGAPQITTTTRGYGWVAWPILSPIQGNRLSVRAVRLPRGMPIWSASSKSTKRTRGCWSSQTAACAKSANCGMTTPECLGFSDGRAAGEPRG